MTTTKTAATKTAATKTAATKTAATKTTTTITLEAIQQNVSTSLTKLARLEADLATLKGSKVSLTVKAVTDARKVERKTLEYRFAELLITDLAPSERVAEGVKMANRLAPTVAGASEQARKALQRRRGDMRKALSETFSLYDFASKKGVITATFVGNEQDRTAVKMVETITGLIEAGALPASAAIDFDRMLERLGVVEETAEEAVDTSSYTDVAETTEEDILARYAQTTA